MEWFGALFLGHLIGDYIFQNNWMAQNKVLKGKQGNIACTIHSLEYTVCILLSLIFFAKVYNIISLLILFPLIFISHYPIDKVSFAKWWLKNYNKKNLPGEHTIIDLKSLASLIFYWVVYLIVDNTMHLVLMSLALKFIL